MTNNNEQKQETIAELKARIAALEAEDKAKDEELDLHKSKSVGWLVKTPVPNESVCYGLKFNDGMCFIARDQEVAYFKQVCAPDNVMANYNEVERAAIEKALKISSSERAVITLTNDFGYSAQFYGPDESEALEKAIAARHIEAQQFRAQKPKLSEFMEMVSERHHL